MKDERFPSLPAPARLDLPGDHELYPQHDFQPCLILEDRGYLGEPGKYTVDYMGKELVLPFENVTTVDEE